ncbi:hypothetical protein RU98_GL002615 [Enterococcus caccae]|nr:hypothetical protein RU98_GL002615 [Enterococcus caccae]
MEEFQLTQRFTHKTKEYYIAKTMVSMLLFDIKEGQKGLEKKGHQDFSSGKVQYEYDRIRLKFIVQLNQKTYRFQEDYREDEKEKNKLKSKKGE